MKRLVYLCSFFIAFGLSFYVSAKDRLNVFVSILPQSYLVEEIAKDKVTVSVLIPPGGNPHTYEPKPGQLKALSRADLYIKVGSGLEFETQWMKKITSLNPGMRVIDSSEGIKLIRISKSHTQDIPLDDFHSHNHKHSRYDPHIWLGLDNSVIMAENIKTALIQADSDNAAFYSENTDRLRRNLSQLKEEIKQRLSQLEARELFVFHPAWGYFALEFDLVQTAVEDSGKEPSPRQLAGLIRAVKNSGVKVIFVSPQFSQKSAGVIAAETGAEIILADPLAKDYIDNLNKISAILAGTGE
jgi:zinc transport system substrate-binding protein